MSFKIYPLILAIFVTLIPLSNFPYTNTLTTCSCILYPLTHSNFK